MVKRPSDTTPEPPGGRAAERLRMFEQARRPSGALKSKTTKSGRGPKKPKTQSTGAHTHEEQARRKD